MTTSISPRPHQERALGALVAAFKRTDRAQLHWACGTGKTLVGRWLQQRLGARTTLVVVPSLALIAQTITEWQSTGEPFDAIVACSDPTTTDAWRVDAGWWTDHGARVTTDDRPVAAFLTGNADTPRVVFSTYHSAPMVATAARRACAVFDLAVLDEAHRINPAGPSGVVLDARALPVTRRLFQTATPAAAMTDVAVYGPVADRLEFGEAIRLGLLVDYQVLVLDSNADTSALTAAQTVPVALAAAAREGLTKVLSFHSRVAAARRFAADISGLRLPDGRRVVADAVAGSDRSTRRREALAALAAGAPDAVTVLSNARCLAEGVDVPTVDGVLFADPKSSSTDIMQAIGRALRPAPGKSRGLIILPVPVPRGGEDVLSAGVWAPVWDVLRALRSLDERLAAELDDLGTWTPSARRAGDHVPVAKPGALLRFELPAWVDLSRVAARVITANADDGSWWEHREALKEWAAENGHTAVPNSAVRDGHRLGMWVLAQRRSYAAGSMTVARARELSRIPGWAWTTDGAWRAADQMFIAATAEPRLDVSDADAAAVRLPHRASSRSMTVGRWCALQRLAYRRGDLTTQHEGDCEAIPGWSWDAGVAPADQRTVDALAEWVEKHGDANVPTGSTWGTLALGALLDELRRRRAVGRLAQPLLDEILAVTPASPAPGVLDWKSYDTLWRVNFDGLRQYVARTGSCLIPENFVEDTPDGTVRVYQWATRQRFFRRQGRLTEERIALLESVPGWRWEVELAPRVRLDALPADKHGTRTGYVRGCRCEPCTDANRLVHRATIERPADAPPTRVDAAPMCGKLRLLEGQCGPRTRRVVQVITGLNKKTIDEISNGTRGKITREVHDILDALTVQQIREFIAANPNRVDTEPTGPVLALVEELVELGFSKAWLARELGGDRALQVGRSGVIRKTTADEIRRIHAVIGGRRAPASWRSAVPALSELFEGAAA